MDNDFGGGEVENLVMFVEVVEFGAEHACIWFSGDIFVGEFLFEGASLFEVLGGILHIAEVLWYRQWVFRGIILVYQGYLVPRIERRQQTVFIVGTEALDHLFQRESFHNEIR